MRPLERAMVVDSLEEMCDLICGGLDPEVDEHEYCLRCGRKLKSEKARQLGYGDVCYRKLHTDKHSKKLF